MPESKPMIFVSRPELYSNLELDRQISDATSFLGRMGTLHPAALTFTDSTVYIEFDLMDEDLKNLLKQPHHHGRYVVSELIQPKKLRKYSETHVLCCMFSKTIGVVPEPDENFSASVSRMVDSGTTRLSVQCNPASNGIFKGLVRKALAEKISHKTIPVRVASAGESCFLVLLPEILSTLSRLQGLMDAYVYRRRPKLVRRELATPEEELWYCVETLNTAVKSKNSTLALSITPDGLLELSKKTSS